MKPLTILIPTAMSVMLASSCTHMSDISCDAPDTGNEIVFGVSGVTADVSSKSSPLTISSVSTIDKTIHKEDEETLSEKGFMCTVVRDGSLSTMFLNEKFTLKDGLYKSKTKTYYYPTEGTISCYAVRSDHWNCSTSISDDGDVSFNVSGSTGYDYLAAKACGISKPKTPVNLQFEHIKGQININVKGQDPTMVYKLSKAVFTAISNADYSFRDGWESSSDTDDYHLSDVERSPMTVSTDAFAPLTPSMCFIPGTINLALKWTCETKDTGETVAQYDETIIFDALQGHNTTLNITLGNFNASKVEFTTSVSPWIEDDNSVLASPAAEYAVNAVAGTRVFLPSINFPDNVRGVIKWGDGTIDKIDGTKEYGHTYSTAFKGNAELWISQGVAYAEMTSTRLKKFKVLQSDRLNVTQHPYAVGFSAQSSQTLALVIPDETNSVKPDFEYSYDNSTWTDWDYSPLTFGTEENPKLYIRGSNPDGFYNGEAAAYNPHFSFGNPSVDVVCSGNIMHLLDYTQDLEEIPCNYCFCMLFAGTSINLRCPIRVAPELPATVLKKGSYYSMFSYGKLKIAPELPALVMEKDCYSYMFQGSTLTYSPALPSVELAEGCYSCMFIESMVSAAPALNAEVLQKNCYNGMFSECSGLSTISEIVLPAPILAEGCYANMFNSTQVGKIKILATDISAANCLTSWLSNAKTSGTIKIVSGVEYPSGSSGIPSGWTVEILSL